MGQWSRSPAPPRCACALVSAAWSDDCALSRDGFYESCRRSEVWTPEVGLKVDLFDEGDGDAAQPVARLHVYLWTE